MKKTPTNQMLLTTSFIHSYFFPKHTDTKSGYTYSSLTRARDIISIVLYKSLSINNLQGNCDNAHTPSTKKKF